jgi:DNA-directed RNA polymerase specialized sigma24 family protein
MAMGSEPMDPFVPDDETTREGNLADWRAFSLAYYEPIRRALRLLRVPEGELEDLAHSFLLKATERDFLATFRAFRQRQEEDGRRVRFRTYLYRSIQNHVRDFYRKTGPGARTHGLDLDAAMTLVDDPRTTLDPDAIYALDVLHQAIQALRRHCERSGKPQYWVFFEETFLADEFRGRRGRSRAELLQAFPEFDARRLDNALTTAKRAFRRFVEGLIPRGLREEAGTGERFEEWMALLRESHASQFNLLHVAYRVMPYLAPEMSHAASTALVVDTRRGGSTRAYQEPGPAAEDDELGILLGFHLELPLTELIDAAELLRYIPPSSPLLSLPRTGSRPHPGGRRTPPRAARPACLLTLVDPTPAESEALAQIDLVGLLARLKLLAKQLRHRPDHTVPEVISQLLYTITSVLGVVRCDVGLHTISPRSLAGNIRWFLGRPWLDDRIRPLLLAGLDALGSSGHAADDPAPAP